SLGIRELELVWFILDDRLLKGLYIDGEPADCPMNDTRDQPAEYPMNDTHGKPTDLTMNDTHGKPTDFTMNDTHGKPTDFTVNGKPPSHTRGFLLALSRVHRLDLTCTDFGPSMHPSTLFSIFPNLSQLSYWSVSSSLTDHRLLQSQPSRNALARVSLSVHLDSFAPMRALLDSCPGLLSLRLWKKSGKLVLERRDVVSLVRGVQQSLWVDCRACPGAWDFSPLTADAGRALGRLTRLGIARYTIDVDGLLPLLRASAVSEISGILISCHSRQHAVASVAKLAGLEWLVRLALHISLAGAGVGEDVARSTERECAELLASRPSIREVELRVSWK
ncbi:MAG: hypothetical protein SGCHY_002804, partial [Lobulomycetales sp.]